MNKGIKITLIVVAVLLGGAFVYWQFIKKRVVRNAIENAVSKGTDDDYYVKYESSIIDEINGNATFTNIVLQSDSLQRKLFLDDTSVSATIFNIRVAELRIRGANIPSFLQKNTVEANKIEIVRPVITIIQTGKEVAKLTAKDSLALYDRLTGKFKSIQAGEINIIDASIAFAKGKNPPHTTLQDVNINLKNLKIDSTRNYDNIASYFIKDVVATVKHVTTVNEKNGNVFMMDDVEYNAPGRFISIGRIFQEDSRNRQLLIDLKGSTVRGISTNDFIINRKIKADSVTTNGGLVSIYRNKRSGSKNQDIEIDNDFFDEAWIKNIRLDNTTLMIYNRANLAEPPIVIKRIQFDAFNIAEVQDGTNLKRLIANSNWKISGDGLSLNTADKNYRISLGPFVLNNGNSTVQLDHLSLTPLMTEAAFMKLQKVQKDQYNFQFKNISLSGINVRRLVNEQAIIADKVVLQPILRIYNDRTLPFDTTSKIGLYPQQQLAALDIPVSIKRLELWNGIVSYRERGRLSTQTGNVFFNDLSGVVSNVTNIPEDLARNNKMIVKASASFLGVTKITSTWTLPVTTGNSTFTADGTLGSFDASRLNSIIEPLGMAKIERGQVSSFRFSLSADDYRSKGDAVLIYKNLKIKLLKNTGDNSPDIKTKSVTSFVANLVIRDQNPSNGTTRTAEIDFKRDIQKSFFNLLWKSVFQGAKKVASGKNDGK